MSDWVPVITIDGPGGSGKGTLTRLLANKLGWGWLDSGAIYRLMSVAVARSGVDLADTDALVALAGGLNIAFRDNPEGEPMVLLEGEDVTAELRTESTGAGASKLAAIPELRAALLQRQRDFRQPPGLVADGRDMGTVVFPDAPVKLFLTASIEERTRRRYKQLKDQGVETSMDALFREISERDERDVNRSVAPLRPADDAKVVDCSSLSIDDMLDCALKLVVEKGLLVA